MKIAATLCATALAVMLAGHTQAADAQGNFLGYGAGTQMRCAEFSATGVLADSPLEAWLMGYVTAINIVTEDTYDIVGSGGGEALYKAIAEVCKQNPEADLVEAVEPALQSLADSRHRVPPHMAPAEPAPQ